MKRKSKFFPHRYEAGYLGKLDGRTALAIELRDKYNLIAADLGGTDHLSYMQRSLIERALWLEHFLTLEEQFLSRDDLRSFEPTAWVSATKTLIALYSRLGLERRTKTVTPDLSAYMDAVAAE